MMTLRHLPRQLPVVASVAAAMVARGRTESVRAVPPIDHVLIRDYVAHVGGDPRAYRDTVPAHLFPLWALGPAARTVPAVYALHRVLNGGCRLEVRAPLPARTPLKVRAELLGIDDDGKRAVLTQRVSTGTHDVPEAVVATIRAVVPKAVRRGQSSRTEVPFDAAELARWPIEREAGLEFALLTGDFNPIHWSRQAANAAGFARPILHGFAMFARAIEGIVRTRLAGDASRAMAWDAKFVRPLELPADIALFGHGRRAWLGDAPGGVPYMVMSFEELA